MKIYICDCCGARVESKRGIVGNEFDYVSIGFETLAPAYRENGVRDVCKKCFAAMQSLVTIIRDEHAKGEKSAIRKLLSSMIRSA